MGKSELLTQCVRVMVDAEVTAWYKKNLQSQPQSETIKSLEEGVAHGEVSLRAALCIALIVGFQWNLKFEGVP